MARNALYHLGTIDYITGETPFKKLSLYFDKIFVPYKEFKKLATTSYSVSLPEFNEQLTEYLTELDFLSENNLVEYYDMEDVYKKASIAFARNTNLKKLVVDEFVNLASTDFSDNRIENDYKWFIENATGDELEELKNESWKDLYRLGLVNHTNHLRVRAEALIFTESSNSDDFFSVMPKVFQIPTVNTIEHSVTEFILKKLPQPSLSTSWEQIFDFRNDADVKNKYLSLINWINKATLPQSNLKHFFDEYEYLYSEYEKSFRYHKMKYNESFFSILVNAIDNFTSDAIKGKFLSAVKDLLSFKENRLIMLEAETKLPGREISYILHANDKFKA